MQEKIKLCGLTSVYASKPVLDTKWGALIIHNHLWGVAEHAPDCHYAVILVSAVVILRVRDPAQD